MESIEAQLSRFRPESELSQLNASNGRWVSVSDTLFANLQAAKHGARLTGGLYNPLILPAMIAAGYDGSIELINPAEIVPPDTSHLSVPEWQSIEIDMKNQAVRLPAGAEIDLGGIAKGWVADLMVRRLSTFGPCLVSAGGDIVAGDAPEGYDGWHVQVAEPASDLANLLAVSLKQRAIITSGLDRRQWQHDNRQYSHIIDPRTGCPVETDIQSVTIIHRHAPTAEVYAKAVLIAGSEAGLNWLNGQWNSEGMIVCKDGAVLATRTFQSYIVKEVNQ
jgi:thiamine biosynthesis lipoprotein